jgi:hypothetical protein
MGKQVQAIERHRLGDLLRRRVLVAPLLLLPLAAAAPGSGPAADYVAAPLPRLDIEGPTEDTTPRTKVLPHLFSATDTGSFWGNGYTPGSTIAETEETRWFHATPGIVVSVPLQ